MAIQSARITSTSSRQVATLGALLIIFFLGMGLRLYQLDADSLWGDEVFTAITSQIDLRSMPSFLATSDVHPPLYYLIAKLGVGLWGAGEFTFRLPAALLGSASILLAYRVGKTLWGRREGLIAAFLLSVNAFHIHYSQEARGYSLMVFLGLLSLIFLLLALQRGQRRMWFLFAVCSSLNLYTHNFAFLVLASEALFAAWVIVEDWRSSRHQPGPADPGSTTPAHSEHQLLASRDLTSPPGAAAAASGLAVARKQACHLAMALVLVGLLYLPWYPVVQQQMLGRFIGFTGLGFGEPSRGAHFSIQFFTEALQAYTGVGGALLLLFLSLFAIGLASSRARYIVLFGLWILPPFVLPFIARSGVRFDLRYAISVVPLFLLGMARGISVLVDWLTQRLPLAREHQHRSLAVASILTVAVLGAVSVGPVRTYYLWQKMDYRGVARYLERTLLPGDLILVDGVKYGTGTDAWWTKFGLSYYVGAVRLEQTPVLAVERGLWDNLQRLAEPRGEVVAVLGHRTRPPSWDHQEDAVIIDFADLSVIRLRQSTGETIPDAKAILEALVKLLPRPNARFDARLALAETNAEMGMYSEAASQVVLAARGMPDSSGAAEDLAQTIDLLQPSLHVQPEDIRVGDSLTLRGFSQQPTTLRAGEPITVTLWWETRDQMDIDYSTFIHVIEPSGRVVVQKDRPLRSRTRTTSSWNVGELVRDRHRLELPPGLEPSAYVIRVGVYYWKTGERLPVWDESGRRMADDAIILAPAGET